MGNAWRAIALLGPPGSGKGTQGRAIGALPGFFHYVSGDTLRNLDPHTELGQKVRSCTEAGELVPSKLVSEVCQQAVHEAIGRGQFDPVSDTIILDGLPRNIDQARDLAAYARIKRIVHLACEDHGLLTERIQHRGDHRTDDLDPSVAAHRFRVYEQQTAPVLEYYPAALIARVDAAQPPICVLHQIAQTLFGVGI